MITRREWLGAAAGAGVAGAAARKPNVVVIFCDDLGYGDVGSFGSSMKTPNIDSLARDGIRFTHFYSGNPVCSPSRAALLTGRYPVRVGVPRVFFPYDTTGLPLQETTLADLLKKQGYRTQCVGKWHLGHHPEYLPTRRGFDGYFGIPYSNDMSPRWLMDGEKVIEEQATLETLTPRYTERAVKFIEDSKGSPFFLYMPHTYPHVPLAASSRFRGKSPQGLYGDVISELDWSVGEVLSALKRTDAEKDTLVVFTSDNGPWFQGSPGRLRGRKGMTWEGGQRVPFIARYPGRIPKGRSSAGVASLMDITPTIAKLCGASPLPNPPDGVDIWPMLDGSRPSIEREALLMFDTMDLQCARWGKWKLHLARRNVQIYNPAPAGGAMTLPLPAPELYDVTTDVDESYDVAAENPNVVAEMRRRIDGVMAGMPEPVRTAWTGVSGKKVGRSWAGQAPRPAPNR
ncbi:MAG: sulfatase [Bryobacteraceae bacterium]